MQQSAHDECYRACLLVVYSNDLDLKPPQRTEFAMLPLIGVGSCTLVQSVGLRIGMFGQCQVDSWHAKKCRLCLARTINSFR